MKPPKPTLLLVLAALIFTACEFVNFAAARHPAFRKSTLETNPEDRIWGLFPDVRSIHKQSLNYWERIATRSWRDWRDDLERDPNLLARYNGFAPTLCYGLAHALLGPHLEATIPVNLAVLLLTLILAFRLGTVLGGTRAGWGTAATALLPSLFIHFLQPGKDGLHICGQLLILLALLESSCRQRGPADRPWRWFLCALAGLELVYVARTRAVYENLGPLGLVWLWHLARLAPRDGAPPLAARVRNLALASTLLAALGLLAQANLPLLMSQREEQASGSGGTKKNEAPLSPPLEVGLDTGSASRHPPESRQDGWAQRLGRLRQGFIIKHPSSLTNIDGEIRFAGGWGDVAAYLPRAALVGSCAPFPALWWSEGRRAGRAGRLIAGAEMLVMYVMMSLAAFFLWCRRGEIRAWLPAVAAASHLVLLGLIVPNVGAIYRMRYASWFVLVAMGMAGWGLLRDRRVGAGATQRGVPTDGAHR